VTPVWTGSRYPLSCWKPSWPTITVAHTDFAKVLVPALDEDLSIPRVLGLPD